MYLPVQVGGVSALRVPAASDSTMCPCTQSQRRVFQFDMPTNAFAGGVGRISVGEPWWIGEPYAWTIGLDLSVKREGCLETEVRRCVVIPDYGPEATVSVRIITDNPGAPARNVIVEHAPAGSTCP